MEDALADLRVLDLAMFWAGPSAAGLLADFGAQVIKIEACSHPDPIRINARNAFPENEPGARPWNRSGMIIERNRNKYSLALDLATPEGKELFKRLVRVSDVILENFRSGVMERFGLDYPVLSRINPSLIMLSLSSRGTTGPEREYISYGNTLEALAGLSSITGYPDQAHLIASLAYPDPAAALGGAGMILAAVEYRRRTGKGTYLDLSQLELVATVVGEAYLEYSLSQNVPQPSGNRNPMMAPHGCYRCAGDDEWVVIEVGTEEQWRSLCRVIGYPNLVDDARFAEPPTRWRNQDELTSYVQDWTCKWDPHEVMHRLQGIGVPCGVVASMDELFTDPHLAARHWFRVYEQPGEVGPYPYPYRGTPFILSETPCWIRRPAPAFGEHNRAVLSELLGLVQGELDRLEKKGVIGTVPTEAALFSLLGEVTGGQMK